MRRALVPAGAFVVGAAITAVAVWTLDRLLGRPYS